MQPYWFLRIPATNILTYPALQSGAGGGLYNIWWVHSHVETQHQGHAHRLHLVEKKEKNISQVTSLHILNLLS